MRELAFEGRRCGVCGARVACAREGGAVYAEGGAGSFFRAPEELVPRRATRERSGLAYAAGYAGVLYLFRNSFAPLLLSGPAASSALGMLLVLAFSLLAPLALALSFAAGDALDRSPWKSGVLPALFGLLVGLAGTVNLLLFGGGLWP